MKKMKYVTMSNGVLQFMDKENMYFVVLGNYLKYHRDYEDDYDRSRNGTPMDRIRNTKEFIKAEIEKRTGMFTDYPVFCTGHSLGGLFAEILTLNESEIQQCESFNSMKEGCFSASGIGEGDDQYDEAIINEIKAIKELYATESKKEKEKA